MIVLILIWMSIQDIKTQEVNTISQLILLVICIFNYTNIVYFLLLLIIFIILNKLFRDKMGGADYKILLMLSLVYGYQILYIILIACISAVPFSIKEIKIPFIPFITLGVICLNFVT